MQTKTQTNSEFPHLSLSSTMEKLGDNVSQALNLLLKPISLFLDSRHRRGALLKKLGYGLMGAAYACMALTVALALAAAIGVGTVRMWVEEPVVVKESLFFDYTEFRPNAFFSFEGGAKRLSALAGVPVGHTYHVSVVLVLPESSYNRDLGVFQLTAEVLSTSGTVMARSSQPCMLQYRSWPIRLTRIFLMGVPLLFGTTLEAQNIKVNLLRYHEARKSSLRTGSIRITLSPRAGTMSLPELYESHILIQSQLPWPKELVRSWKWTFYVWTSLYVYIMLLALMLCCFRPLVFLGRIGGSRVGGVADMGGGSEFGERRGEEDMDAETLRKWQQYRRKRKAEVLGRLQPVESLGDGSSATSYTLPREEEIGSGGWGGEEEEVADTSSVCS